MRFCGNCGTRLEGVAVLTQPQEFNPQELGVMMGAGLLERLKQAGIEAAGQRRKVTVLFADLSGYTGMSSRLDSEEVYELVQQFIRMLVDQVYKYEGVVDKLTGDGLMALFGAPIMHENNPERAIRSALDMQGEMAKLAQGVKDRLGIDLRMRIGLHFGSVVVGGIGSNLLMNYTAIGDTVNLARRIEEAAEAGTILVSEAVFRQTQALFEYQPVPGLQLKGFDGPLNAYRVCALKTRPGPLRGLEGLRAPMIGRDSELIQLKEAIDQLKGEKLGKLILITGEAGIGKSRLTAELKARVPAGAASEGGPERAPGGALTGAPTGVETGVRILEGHSLTYRKSVSYWIFLDLLHGYFGFGSHAPEALVRQKLRDGVSACLGARAAEALPYLEHLFSLKPSDPMAAERIRYLDASQIRQQVFLAVRDLLGAEARRQPLLVILEDLHWADEASLDLLQFLVDTIRQAPITILAISRPFQDGQMASIARRAEKLLGERFLSIRLKHLSQDQAEDLLSRLLTAAQLPENLRAQILERAAGYPFYLEEILRTLIDEGILRRGEEGWEVDLEASSLSLGVPDTVQGLILARFDRLPEATRHVLQVASVIGHHFGAILLKALLPPGEGEALEEILDSLVKRDFILPPSGELQGEYSFRHVLMSEAIYATLLKRDRSRLHGLVGEALETQYASRLEEHVELLARHYTWSTRLDRALHFVLLAAQKSAQGYANAQARQNFEAALEILSKVEHSPDQFQQVHSGLGDILVLTGDYLGGREHYQLAREALLAGEQSCGEKCGALLRKISTTYERQGDYDQALRCLSEAGTALEAMAGPAKIERARILNDLGWIQFRRGNLDEAQDCLLKALSYVEWENQYDVIASIYNRLGGVFYQKDALDQASRYVRKSLVLREEIGDIAAVARSYNNLGLLGWKRGDWDNALENFRRSVDLHATLGDVEGMIDLHSNLGLLLMDRGDFVQAQKHFKEALASAQQIGHSYHISFVYLYLCRLYVALEDWQAALDYSQRSQDSFREIGALDHLVDVYTYAGLAWLGLGDLEKARKAGEQALEVFKTLGTGKLAAQAEDRGRALRLLGDVARQEGDFTRSEKLLLESAGIFEIIGNQLEQGRSAISLAALAADRKDLPAARMHLNEARLIFLQLRATQDLQKVDALVAALSVR
jgi:predicted ATPase/class 3 adenylate cyclase